MTVNQTDMADTDLVGIDDSATEATDSNQRSLADSDDLEPKDNSGKGTRQLRLSITFRGLLTSLVIIALTVAVGVLSWLYIGSRHELDVQAQRSDNYAHAEKVALTYAVNAAEMNFGDLGGWKTKLVAGTSPELNAKLTKAAGDMEQILVPLQWASTATPLAAKVRSDSGPVYVVDCFVSVMTKTSQGPDPLQSTATYSITLDRSQNWQITDVGGIGSALGQK
jgi:hypothetical protein